VRRAAEGHHWISGGQEQPNRKDKLPLRLPGGVRIQPPPR
jgi:hypothetical protein